MVKHKSLSNAAYKGNVEAVKMLIDAGADVNAKDRYENTSPCCQYAHRRNVNVTDADTLLRAAEGGYADQDTHRRRRGCQF